ncbi:MAG: response regulator [Calditrichia bacterium]
MSKYNILVVDDDYASRLFLQKTLEKDNYRVTPCKSGDEALKELKADHYHMVISDLRMQGIDGLELLKQIKKTDYQISVIILTGHASIQTAIEALRLGASDYLTKPVNMDELKIRVSKAIERLQLELKLKEAERQMTYHATITTANHEINQPLTVILSGTDMLAMELEKRGLMDNKLGNYIHMIQKAGHRIATILRRFREISSPVIQSIPHGMKMIELEVESRKSPEKIRQVLVIEDEENLRQVFKEILETEGIRVITASNGEDGYNLYKAQSKMIDLVLLDFYLPDAKAPAVLNKLRSCNPHVKVVLTSGFQFDEEMRKTLDKGAIGFLGKPFDRDQMVNFVKEALSFQKQTYSE